MRNLILSLLGFLAGGAIALPATAQQVDNTLNLPDAQPGECYAKVMSPPQFDLSSEEVVIQEASERIEIVEAQYKAVQKTQLVKDATEALEVSDAVFETEVERVEVRAEEQIWTISMGEQTIPASTDVLDQVTRSGVELGTVAPDTCFTEYFIDAKYETQTEQVLIKEAVEKITVIPAKFETVQERVVVKEASTQVVELPAVYRTESESVLVEPSRNAWQECGKVDTSDNQGGEMMCLIKVPERYETLTKTVLDKPATSKIINIPAVYKTVEVQRLVEPAKEEREQVPAEYRSVSKRVRASDPVFFWLAKDAEPEAEAKPTGRTLCLETQPAEFVAVERQLVAQPALVSKVSVPATFETIPTQELVSEASERRIAIPERTRTITTRVQTAPAKLEWQQVLCKDDMTPENILLVQQALKREGFNPGPIDGIIGRGTLDAMESFQAEHSLGRGGITYKALEKLEVDLSS